MTYRLPVSAAFTLACCLAACADEVALPTRPDRSTERPNIVIVLADDLGYGDPRCYAADSKIPTPNVDRMADEGMLFTDAHSPSAVCTPTRYGLLTGRYCWRTRLQSEVASHWDPLLIEAETLTLPQLLQRAGYATACIGKWHLGIGEQQPGDFTEPDRKKRPRRTDYAGPLKPGPNACGFDYFFGATGKPGLFIRDESATPAEVQSSWFIENETLLEGDPEEWRHRDVGPILTERAVDWIEKTHAAQPDQPLFLYFATTAVHEPLTPARFAVGLGAAGKYGDYVAELDWSLGEIRRALEEAGIADDTLLIFTSDNGSSRRNEKLSRMYGHRVNGSLRGWKRDIWEGGHRVPFIASWPEHIRPGSRSAELVSLTDLMATMAAITGADLGPTDAPDSFDLSPVLLGASAGPPVRATAVLHSSGGEFALRQGRWKWIDCPGPGNETPTGDGERASEAPGQLYDLESDPGEVTNLYHDRPELVEELSTKLAEIRSGVRTR